MCFSSEPMYTCRTAITLLLIALLIPCPSQSQDVENLMTLHEKSWGQAILTQIRSVQFHLLEVTTDQRTEWQLTRKRPDKFRLDNISNNPPLTLASDGTLSWLFANDTIQAAPAKMKRKIALFPHLDSPLVRHRQDSLPFAHLGKNELNGLPLEVIRVALPNQRLCDFYLNALTGQLYKMTERDAGNEKYIFREVFFKNYKPQAGIDMPMEYEVREKGRVSYLIVKEVVLGIGVANSVFRQPE